MVFPSLKARERERRLKGLTLLVNRYWISVFVYEGWNIWFCSQFLLWKFFIILEIGSNFWHYSTHSYGNTTFLSSFFPLLVFPWKPDALNFAQIFSKVAKMISSFHSRLFLMWPLSKSALLHMKKKMILNTYGYDCGQLFFKFSPFWVSPLHHEAETTTINSLWDRAHAL